MANPNQGPPPSAPGASGPPPGTNANTEPDPSPGPTFPVRDIDLSDPMFTSDGVMQQHQATVDVEFLSRLSGCFNHQPNFVTTLGYNVNFIGGLPQGYVLETLVCGRRTDGSVALDYFVRGHPSGRSFRSMTQLTRHVYHIMRNDLPNCNCDLC
ncbi:hypothetical protein KCU95_g14504, partial [Aureobasidium melanogenum]